MSRIIFAFESLNILYLLCHTLAALFIAACKLFLPFVHFPRNVFLVVQLPVKTCFLWTLFPWTLHFVEWRNLEPTSVSSSLWHSRVMLLPFFSFPSGHTVKRSQFTMSLFTLSFGFSVVWKIGIDQVNFHDLRDQYWVGQSRVGWWWEQILREGVQWKRWSDFRMPEVIICVCMT